MKFSNRSLTNLQGIHPNLVRVMTEAIKDTPIDFTITDGVRTIEQQKALYAKGRTAPGPKVTNADGVSKKSNHQIKGDGYGYAVDLYPYINGRVDVNAAKELKIIAKHILSVADRLGILIEWGGNWTSLIDYPHFELVKK